MSAPASYAPDNFPPLRDCLRERAAFVAHLEIDGRERGPGVCVEVGGDLVLIRRTEVASLVTRALIGPIYRTTTRALYVENLPAPREANVGEREAARLARFAAEEKARWERWREAYRARRKEEIELGERALPPFDPENTDESAA